MSEDKFDLMGPLLNDVGNVLAAIADGDPEGVFLYVEIGDGWISPNIFKDEGKLVRWLDPSDNELTDLLYRAWRLEPEGKRWSVMEYDIKDGKFAVSFKYPDEVDVESFDEDRREKVLRARYGDKPVVYPPLEGMFELKP
ncbi:hypothetical protein MZO42_10305 [Sphingomonas psychrotolerans]|uniref:DUF600 family protein n=1 Tax=Sphingomonas psychrotolerans TaxID=1327635 RepID=A0ABU3N3I2_9SPHN|nr:hypothetical protein [Sphingomonas psychrotolerans]MDT8759090.1 hypothetical protein [Sphingomonas psychrotolerans]